MNAAKMSVAMVVVMVGGMLMAEVAQAVAIPTILQGTQSLNIQGWMDDDGRDIEIYLQGSYGYFMKDLVQVGGYGSFDIYGSDYTRIEGGVFGEQDFDIGGQLVPYAGGRVGLTWQDMPDDSKFVMALNGYGGARYFLVDYAAVGLELNAALATAEIYNQGADLIDWWMVINTSWYF